MPRYRSFTYPSRSSGTLLPVCLQSHHCSIYLSHEADLSNEPSESPRLSSFLVFLLSGSICYGVSCFTKWLPGADGRFTASRRGHNAPLLDGAGKEFHNGQSPYLPKRPRRLSLPVLVLCIVLRLEIFHRVNYQQQCSTPGVEVKWNPNALRVRERILFSY